MNTLYYGDNLPILRNMAAESVDLVYLDPPFNSARSYNVLFKETSGKGSDSQITAFDDTWSWGPAAEQVYTEIIQANPGTVDDMLAALRKIIGDTPMLAYLVMMAARLVELHRVLKPTGSLYLHCDPTASHYLKIILDSVFGVHNYRNEIVWQRINAKGNVQRKFGAVHDVILAYSKKIGQETWNQTYRPLDTEYVDDMYRYVEEGTGRRYRLSDLSAPASRASKGQKYEWKGYSLGPSRVWVYAKEKMQELEDAGRIVYSASGYPNFKRYLDENLGEKVPDVWVDIKPVLGGEALGYPTQKPLALLERIVNASSNPGDVVLDPFCGCGTAVAAAQKLGRQWIGIDITYLSINLIENRMRKMFPGIRFEVEGKPCDLFSARDLALRDRYQFQWWALSLIGAKPVGDDGAGKGKKGKDKGIDGVINYIDNAKQDLKHVLVQVKSGGVNSGTIRDLVGVLSREQAEIGVLVTLENPSKDMTREAATAGYYQSEFWQRSYPRLQILTVEQLLAGASVQMPPETGTFMAAQKVRKSQGEQKSFLE